ncbi:MAG: PHB depolymerase family esterase, partial [Burkholderiales bacterium]
MAKKKRNPPDRRAPAGVPELAGSGAPLPTQAVGRGVSEPSAPARPRASAAPAAPLTLPTEVVRGDWTVVILALTMFLAPAIGVPHEEMLQDTLKSIVVSFAALGAALLFFWHQRNRRDGLRWHAVMWLPLLLMAYALGSMVWSHTYLGGVEAIRWFVFSVLLWLGLNTLTRDRLPLLAWGVHWGAVVASLWAALQFWVDFRYFPQGPNPASTFVNRNFFAEFAACTIPFSALLLARARQSAQIALLAVTSGFVLVAILMTGTRGALGAMWLQLLLVLPVIAVLYRKQFAFPQWSAGNRILGIGLLLATVVGLGMINSGNAKVLEEQRGTNALERGFKRTGTISTNDESLNIRKVMWSATVRIIEKRPLTGVGAGAWESDIPLYQVEGSQLETDYYVHNEFLQLLAEYGLAGWTFLVLLLAYLSWAAWRTYRDDTPEGRGEAPFRALLLCALLALFVVSNVGFPWRMASTGALFALCLAGLAASDARLGVTGRLAAQRIAWKPGYSQVAAVLAMAGLALTAYISQQAAESEQKIVKATKLALTISGSGDHGNPKWDKTKTELLKLIKEGTDINPHYRKITPMVADELAKWGDWKNATWIWESVISSRPYVVAIMSNIARGYATMGQPDKALVYLDRAKKIQPNAPAVRSLEVVLLSRTGQESKALALARDAGVVVLYPEQTQRANAQRCWNWFKTQHQQRDRGEPALLAALTRSVVQAQGIDPARVYVAGLSAGGAMADILGRTYPDVFAAVGVHSGLPRGSARDIGSALTAMRTGGHAPAQGSGTVPPLIVFHGDADATVNPSNGQALADAAVAAVAAVGGASRQGESTQGSSAKGGRYTRTCHADASGAIAVEHWRLQGAG